MKRSAFSIFMAAVAMMAAAVTASAQNTMKAEIPFAFQAGSTKMLPGAYQVIANRLGGSVMVVHIRNVDNGKEIITVPRVELNRASSPSAASLTFACLEGACQLVKVNNGWNYEYVYPAPKVNGARLATIALTPERGE